MATAPEVLGTAGARTTGRSCPARLVTLTLATAAAAGCTTLLGDYTQGSTADAADGSMDGTMNVDDGSSTEAAPTSDTGVGGSETGPATGNEGGSDGGNNGGKDGAVDASVDAPPDAPAWTPTVLDGQGKLALWLEASSTNLVISNGLIAEWNDLSKNANNGVNSSGGPPLEPAVINGHNSVHFNARNVTLTIPDAPSLQFGTDQFCMATVARASTSGGYFFSKVTTTASGGGSFYSSGFEFFTSTDDTDDAGNIIVDDAGLTTVFPAAHVDSLSGNQVDWSRPGFEDNEYHLAVVRRLNASELSIALDSHPAQSTQTGAFDVSQAGEAVTLGGVVYGNFASPVDLSVAELVVVHSSSGVVADSDVASLTAYLAQKYGL